MSKVTYITFPDSKIKKSEFWRGINGGKTWEPPQVYPLYNSKTGEIEIHERTGEINYDDITNSERIVYRLKETKRIEEYKKRMLPERTFEVCAYINQGQKNGMDFWMGCTTGCDFFICQDLNTGPSECLLGFEIHGEDKRCPLYGTFKLVQYDKEEE